MKRSKFRTIVVGVDFSDYSKVFAAQAIRLAKHYRASLVFVHAVSPALYTHDIRMYYDISKDVLEPIKEEIKSFYNLNSFDKEPLVVVALAAPATLISSVAEKYANSLIVIGHRGRSAIGRFFLGSTAESLALSAECPVWIHRGGKVRMPKKVLLPSDYSVRSKASLKVAESLANGGRPALQFYHVREAPRPLTDIRVYQKIWTSYMRSEKEKQKRFASVFPRVPLKREEGDVVTSIINESKKYDLVVMAPHNRKGFLSRFGSVSGKVVRTGETPILIAR